MNFTNTPLQCLTQFHNDELEQVFVFFADVVGKFRIRKLNPSFGAGTVIFSNKKTKIGTVNFFSIVKFYNQITLLKWGAL